jgi:hypothetical protein
LSNIPVNGDIVDDPSVVPPGFDLKRREWVILNRFCTSQAKYAYLIHRWSYSDSPVCDCDFAQQTTTHILDCPLRHFEGGLTVLQVLSAAVVYLTCDQFGGLLFHQFFSFHVIAKFMNQ